MENCLLKRYEFILKGHISWPFISPCSSWSQCWWTHLPYWQDLFPQVLWHTLTFLSTTPLITPSSPPHLWSHLSLALIHTPLPNTDEEHFVSFNPQSSSFAIELSLHLLLAILTLISTSLPRTSLPPYWILTLPIQKIPWVPSHMQGRVGNIKLRMYFV